MRGSERERNKMAKQLPKESSNGFIYNLDRGKYFLKMP